MMNETVKLVIGGDLFPVLINYQLFSQGNTEALFGEEITGIFQGADYAVCNLEGVFTVESTKPRLKDGPNIRAPRECVKAYRELGVDCVSLANNHATDYGEQGLGDTIRTLDEAGIRWFGAGMNSSDIKTHFSAKVKDKTIVFYGVSETLENAPDDTRCGANIYDEYRICNELRQLKENCDLLIVLYHGGIENTYYNTQSIRSHFHRMADNGADIVVSQHTHAVGEEEYYRGSYLLYGQGNFCFNYSKKLYEWVRTGILLEVDFGDGGLNVRRHLVKRDGDHIVYDKDQDFSAFEKRSDRLKNGDSFEKEFGAYADEKLIVFLQAFRGKSRMDALVQKILSRPKYIKYLKKKYDQKRILKILLALQSEEFREVSTQGMLNLLEASGKTENRYGK